MSIKPYINDVGVTQVYGLDEPRILEKSGLHFVSEQDITPADQIGQLQGVEKIIFPRLYVGNLSRKLYRMYEFQSEICKEKGRMCMLLNARYGIITNTEYIRFGTGKRILVMLPGLGDSLRSLKGTALPFALMYRMFAKDYTVYAFSRKLDLAPGTTTREMARDLANAMDGLDINQADVFGVSMGGMIAQHLAIDYPERVNKLVLAVTCPRPNPILEEAVGEWMACAEAGDHTAFMESNLRRIYSEEYYRKNKWLIPIMGKLTKPKSYDRFFLQAQACLTHNSYESLHRIQAPTLVVGGEKDTSLGGDASREIAANIPGAQLRMYAEWGHGLYEEAKDFNHVVLDFLNQ